MIRYETSTERQSVVEQCRAASFRYVSVLRPSESKAFHLAIVAEHGWDFLKDQGSLFWENPQTGCA